MGCPDWPKCFGRWIPPTSVSELPINYVAEYSKQGHLAEEFNVMKTWTEYVNRLLGVLVGFLIFITMVASLGFWKSNRSIVYYSLVSFLLVGFQGWLGAKVVDSNLKPVVVSIHMLFALVIVALLLKALAIFESTNKNEGGVKNSSTIKWASIVACSIIIIQILVGTQVRQAVDVQALMGANRSEWLVNLGAIFSGHVFTAYMVVFSTGFLLFQVYRRKRHPFVFWSLLSFLLIEYLGGIFMYRFALPSYMQPIHLTCASALFGLSFYLYSRESNATTQN